jgi:hypothetical protein
MLHRCGFAGHVEECLPADQWNARGYWELSSLVRFNERLLADVGAAWSLPPSLNGSRRLKSFAELPEYRNEASRLLGRMTATNNARWFWKDPRLSLLLPFWQKCWSGIRYVVCIRDPYEICLSLYERDGLSFEVSIALWQSYMLSVLEWTRNVPRIFLNYSRILREPSQECGRLARFLDGADKSTMASRPVTEMQKAVDRRLQHFETDTRRSAKLLTTRQKELVKALVGLAGPSLSPTDLDLSRYARSKTWRASLKKDLLLLRCQKFWSRTFLDAPVSPPPADKYSTAWLNRSGIAGASAYDLP